MRCVQGAEAEVQMSALCCCNFCGKPIDSRIALRIARAGGRIYCDESCHIADDANTLERWAALMERA